MAANDDKTTTTEVWLYAGRRLSTKGMRHAWWSPTEPDKTRLFGKPLAASPTVGASYEVELARSGDSVTVHGTPRFVASPSEGDAADRATLDEWRAEDRVAAIRQQAVRLERKAADDDELEAALDVLRRHYRALRTWSDHAAFTAYVTDQISYPPRKES